MCKHKYAGDGIFLIARLKPNVHIYTVGLPSGGLLLPGIARLGVRCLFEEVFETSLNTKEVFDWEFLLWLIGKNPFAMVYLKKPASSRFPTASLQMFMISAVS